MCLLGEVDTHQRSMFLIRMTLKVQMRLIAIDDSNFSTLIARFLSLAEISIFCKRSQLVLFYLWLEDRQIFFVPVNFNHFRN